MLHTTIKGKGKAKDCEIHIIENSIIVKNFYKKSPNENFVKYTPTTPISLEQYITFLTNLSNNIKTEGLLIEDYRFHIERKF